MNAPHQAPPRLIGQPAYVQAPTGLILPEAMAAARYLPAVQPTGFDLFAGCGGFSLGVKQAGFNILGMVEIDFDAVATYMANLCRWGEVEIHFDTKQREHDFDRYLAAGLKRAEKEAKRSGKPVQWTTAGSGWIKGQPRTVKGTGHVFVWDVATLTGSAVLERIGLKRGELDLVFGSPPCQGYSVAGKRQVGDPRNDLTLEFARLVTELQPRSMAMENVPGILSMTDKHGRGIVDQFVNVLERGSFAPQAAMTEVLERQGIKLHRGDVGLRGPGCKATTDQGGPGQGSLFGEEAA